MDYLDFKKINMLEKEFISAIYILSRTILLENWNCIMVFGIISHLMSKNKFLVHCKIGCLRISINAISLCITGKD